MMLLDSDMVAEKPSLIAATALYLAFRSVKNFSPWNAVMVKNTSYKECDLKEFGKRIVASFERLKSLDLDVSVMKKYSKPKQLEVAKIPLQL